MKYAVVMSTFAITYNRNFIKTGSVFQNLIGGTHRHIDTL
jgi:hypothetical protein